MNSYNTGILDLARTLCPPDEDFLELSFRGVPRWLIPMGNLRVRYNSLELYPALRLRGRAYRTLLRAWALAGGSQRVRRAASKGARDWPLGDFLLPQLPRLSTAAIYIGTPGPDQKLTIQLMDGRGKVLGYAKYADGPGPRRIMANEVQMLNSLPERVGPRLVLSTPFLGGDLSVQTCLPGRLRVPHARFYAVQRRFLERLIRPGECYEISEHPFVASLYERAGKLEVVLGEIASRLGDVKWPLAWMHGDLSPWNIRWRKNECRAFDWEYGLSEGMAYVEASHPLIQFAGLVKHTSPEKAKHAISKDLRTFLPARYEKFAPSLASLSALNILISWYPPREPDAYQRWLIKFVEASGG